MNQNRDAFAAQREALQDANAHPERPLSHETATRTYLAGFQYAQSHPQPTTETDEPAQPVDEPVPLTHPAAGGVRVTRRVRG